MQRASGSEQMPLKWQHAGNIVFIVHLPCTELLTTTNNVVDTCMNILD